jgi:hypothetical protein
MWYTGSERIVRRQALQWAREQSRLLLAATHTPEMVAKESRTLLEIESALRALRSSREVTASCRICGEAIAPIALTQPRWTSMCVRHRESWVE